jgi:hypothetical protein
MGSRTMQSGILHALLLLMVVNVLWNLPVLGAQLTYKQKTLVALLSLPTVAQRQLKVARLRERLRIKKMRAASFVSLVNMTTVDLKKN